MEVIPIGYFALTRSLQQRWGDIFSLLTYSDEICKSIIGWDISNIEEYADLLNPNVIKIAQRLLLDRDLQSLLFSDIGKAWLNNSTTRNATI